MPIAPQQELFVMARPELKRLLGEIFGAESHFVVYRRTPSRPQHLIYWDRSSSRAFGASEPNKPTTLPATSLMSAPLLNWIARNSGKKSPIRSLSLRNDNPMVTGKEADRLVSAWRQVSKSCKQVAAIHFLAVDEHPSSGDGSGWLIMTRSKTRAQVTDDKLRWKEVGQFLRQVELGMESRANDHALRQIHRLRHEIHGTFINSFSTATLRAGSRLRNVRGLLTKCLKELQHSLALDRCALFVPTDHSPSLWTPMESLGFTDMLKDISVYRRNSGLTGRTLAIPADIRDGGKGGDERKDGDGGKDGDGEKVGDVGPDRRRLYSGDPSLADMEREYRCILSDDIVNDERWSSKGVSSGLRGGVGSGRSDSADACRSRDVDLGASHGHCVFLGVPIYSWAQLATTYLHRDESPLPAQRGRPLDDAKLPHAALVCMRKVGFGTPFFSSLEIQHVHTVAGLIGLALDTFIWQDDQRDKEQRFRRLSEYWRSSRSDEDKYVKSLEIMQDLGPFGRLLLATYDSATYRIRGKAVVGFEQSLVEDTNRVYYPKQPTPRRESPEDPSIAISEDILSRYLRMYKHEGPMTIDPQHELWKMLHPPTKIKVNLKEKVSLIPLVSSHNAQTGVIVAEFNDPSNELKGTSLREIDILSRMLADLIERDRAQQELSRSNEILHGLLSLLPSTDAQFREPSRVLRRLVEEICGKCEFEHGMVFRYDKKSHVLRGVAGYAVNERSLIDEVVLLAEEPDRKTNAGGRNGTDSSGQAEKSEPAGSASVAATPLGNSSFATRVFCRRQSEFHWDISEEPVQQENRRLLGLPVEASLIGVPMAVGGSVKGVLVFVTKAYVDFLKLSPDSRPDIVPPRELDVYAHFGALLLAISEWLTELKLAQIQSLSERVIMNHVASLAGKIASDRIVSLNDCFEQKETHEILDQIAAESAEVLQADTCCIVLAERPLKYELDNGEWKIKDGYLFSSEDQTSFAIAGHNYKDVTGRPVADDRREMTYRFCERSLTMSVMQSLSTQICPDMAASPLWVKKMAKYSEVDRKIATVAEGNSEDVAKNAPENRDDVGTWLGVPIVCRDGDGIQVFGVLSFARLVPRRVPSRRLSQRDAAIAEKIATLLGLAFSGVELRRGSFNRLLKWYSHDTRKLTERVMWFAIQAKSAIEDSQADSQPLQNAEAALNNLEFYARVLDGAYLAFTDYARSSQTRSDLGSTIGDLFEDVKRLQKYVEYGGGQATDTQLGVTCDEAYRSRQYRVNKGQAIYVVFALVDNANKAINERRTRDRQAAPRGNIHVTLEVVGSGGATIDSGDKRPENGRLRIVVSDNGIGFGTPAKEAFRKCLLPGESRFHCGVSEGAVPVKENRTGLGLAICNSLIEGWQGKLYVEEPSVDIGGARVVVEIPLDD